ncbi:MAG: hypothetical protein RR543_04965 [Erysipelotrichales bacterium]
MELIRRIQLYGVYVLIVGIILIGVFTQNITFIASYVIGAIASNVCFYINYNSIYNIGRIEGVSKHTTGFMVRMLVYAVALAVVLLIFSDVASLFALVGCLTIKHAILIQALIDRR